MTWFLFAALDAENQLTDAYTIQLEDGEMVAAMRAAVRSDRAIFTLEAYELTFKVDQPLKLSMRKSMITVWDDDAPDLLDSIPATKAKQEKQEG